MGSRLLYVCLFLTGLAILPVGALEVRPVRNLECLKMPNFCIHTTINGCLSQAEINSELFEKLRHDFLENRFFAVLYPGVPDNLKERLRRDFDNGYLWVPNTKEDISFDLNSILDVVFGSEKTPREVKLDYSEMRKLKISEVLFPDLEQVYISGPRRGFSAFAYNELSDDTLRYGEVIIVFRFEFIGGVFNYDSIDGFTFPVSYNPLIELRYD